MIVSIYTFESVSINFPICDFLKGSLLFNRSLDSRFGKYLLQRLVKFQFREKWRKEVLKIPRFRKTLNSNQPRYYGFRIGRERTQ